MSNTHQPAVPTSESKKSLPDILERIAVPFALFSIVLLSLLLLSWYLLLPGFTTVDIAGSVRSIADVPLYEQQLMQDIAETQEARDMLVMPLKGSLYENLKEEKRSRALVMRLRSDILHVAISLVPSHPDGVHIQTISFHPSKESVEITGDVRNVGPSSMTVLAQFVDALGHVPSVQNVRASKFVREENAQLGFYSPFTIQLLLE